MRLKRYLVPVLILAVALIPQFGLPQSKHDAMRLWDEAYQIDARAEKKQDREKALVLYERALGMFEKLDDKDKAWRVATNLGKVNSDLGRYSAARESYQKAMDIAKGIGNANGQAEGLNGLGCVYWELGQYAKALDYLRQALEQYKKANNGEGEAFTFNHIGEVYREQGQYASAMDYYQKALDNAKKVRSAEAEADTLHNLGELSRLQARYRDAMDYYNQALDTYRRLGDKRHEGITLRNMGAVYANRGARDEAVDHYQQAMAVFGQGGILGEEARTALEMGRIFQSSGDPKEALPHFEKGVELQKKIGVDTRRSFKLVADVYLDMKDPARAAPFVKQPESPAVEGRFHLVKGEYEAAERAYSKLLQLGEASGDAEDLFTAHTGLAAAYEALEKYKKAETHYTKGMEMVEEIRSGLLPEERTKFFNVRINGFYRSDPAKGLGRVQMRLNESVQSIVTSEATRARAFADRLALGAGSGYAGVPPEILQQERDLVARISSLRTSRGKLPKDSNPQRYDEISREILKAEAEMKAFLERLRKEYARYAAMKYSQPVTVSESALRPDEHVIMFDVSRHEVHVKLIKGKEGGARQFAEDYSVEQLESDVNRFRSAFHQDHLREFDPQLGHKLYTNLMAPVLLNVPAGTHLMIIPDGILHSLPFEALVTSGKETWQKGSGGEHSRELKYLGDAYPISYGQSITALTLARKRARSGAQGGKTLVLADPVFGQDDERLRQQGKPKEGKVSEQWPQTIMSAACTGGMHFLPLRRTGSLAEAIKDLYPGKADVYTGLEAKKSVVTKRSLKDYTTVVFATHGYYDEESSCVNEPILALAGADSPTSSEGLLRMSEVTGLDLNADLVALTACQTALGKQVSGEGTMGLGWAFQWAGARSVLMTLWEVDEEASVKLVKAFFKHLKSGKDKVESLNLAREEIRRSGFEHPYYWAGFTLLGETQ
jgi:CHAT domain-containing protein/Tfp pilus assembly protein PilF